MPVIYADVLVALNWLIDYLLLAAVALVLRIPTRRWRMAVASLLGGVCACLIFLPPMPTALRLLVDIAAAAGMIGVAFSFGTVGAFLKRTVVLFTVSTLFSGVISALSLFSAGEWFLVNNGRVYAAVSPLSLACFAIVSYGIVRLYEWITRKRVAAGGDYRLRIDDGAGVYEGKALHDTGLHLREPFSGAAVIVIERQAIRPFLSPELADALSLRGSPSTRVRMVPYRSVGGNGLLPAFRPQQVQLCRAGERSTDVTGVYVALTDDLGRGEYEALVGNDLT